MTASSTGVTRTASDARANISVIGDKTQYQTKNETSLEYSRQLSGLSAGGLRLWIRRSPPWPLKGEGDDELTARLGTNFSPPITQASVGAGLVLVMEEATEVFAPARVSRIQFGSHRRSNKKPQMRRTLTRGKLSKVLAAQVLVCIPWIRKSK